MQTSELIETLHKQADEIAKAGLRVRGNTMTDSAETLQRYVAAIDAIYNHNAAARAAVIMHFGTLHQTAHNVEVTGLAAASLPQRLMRAEHQVDKVTALAEETTRRYHELLFAVGRKFRDESRHETALRYIREAEVAEVGAGCTAAMGSNV